MGFTYYDTPKNPLTDALRVIVGVEPPKYTHGAYSANDLEEENIVDLQDWCSLNARPEWSTGIGILEAAELIIEEAVSNANIAPKNER